MHFSTSSSIVLKSVGFWLKCLNLRSVVNTSSRYFHISENIQNILLMFAKCNVTLTFA